DLHLLRRPKSSEVFAQVSRCEAQRAGAITVEDGPVKKAPETALNVRRAEPTAVLAVRPGRDQRGEVAPFGALKHLMLKPTRIKARELCVGYSPGAWHSDEFAAIVTGQMQQLAQSFPANVAV